MKSNVFFILALYHESTNSVKFYNKDFSEIANENPLIPIVDLVVNQREVVVDDTLRDQLRAIELEFEGETSFKWLPHNVERVISGIEQYAKDGVRLERVPELDDKVVFLTR